MNQFTLPALAAYIFIIFLIALRNRVFDDGKGFVIGGRRIGSFATGASIAAGLRDGTGIVFWITFSAAVGFGASWLILALAVVTALMAFSAPKVRTFGDSINAVTIQDIIHHTVGSTLSKVTAGIIFLGGILLAAGNLHVMGTMFATILEIPKETTILVTALCVGLYLIIGGYRTVVKTDVFQWLILALISIVPFIKIDWPSLTESAQMMVSSDLPTTIGFIGIGAFYALGCAEYWQRMLSAKKPSTAKRGLHLGSIMILFITLGIITLGMWLAQLLPGTPSDDVYAAIFAVGSPVPTWVATLVALIVMSAVMSTIDTQVSLFSTTLVDVTFKVDTKKDHARFVRLCRAVIVLTMILISIMALYIGDVVSFLLDVVTITMVTGPAYLYAVHTRAKQTLSRDVFLAIIVFLGAVLHLTLFFTEQFITLAHNLIPVTAVATIIGLYALWEKYQEKPIKINETEADV